MRLDAIIEEVATQFSQPRIVRNTLLKLQMGQDLSKEAPKRGYTVDQVENDDEPDDW